MAFAIVHIIGMPPHIIIIGMPISIIAIMRLHISMPISMDMPSPGIISIVMPVLVIFMVQFIMPIIGIMPMGIIPFIMPIGIMPFIIPFIGMGMGIIPIIGMLFIIGIPFIMGIIGIALIIDIHSLKTGPVPAGLMRLA